MINYDLMVLEFNWIILELHKSGKGKCVECKLIQQKCQIISGRYQTNIKELIFLKLLSMIKVSQQRPNANWRPMMMSSSIWCVGRSGGRAFSTL